MLSPTLVLYLWIICSPAAFAITNYHDSYISAYMDFQSSTETPAGVVYPEPPRVYGPPQPKPTSFYGPPSYPPAPQPEYGASDHPLLNMMYHLPEKLEFIPKIMTSFLGVTKVLLTVVLLKIILKFVVMFCLFFFLPKLEMLDMATEMESKPSTVAASASANATMASPIMDDQEEGRLNRVAEFVLESIETKPFLKKYCHTEKHEIKCKLLTLLSALEKYASIQTPKLWLRDTTKNENHFHDFSSNLKST